MRGSSSFLMLVFVVVYDLNTALKDLHFIKFLLIWFLVKISISYYRKSVLILVLFFLKVTHL